MSTSEQEYHVNVAGKLWLKGLSDIKRYVSKDGQEFPEMIHRPDDFIHVRRVMYLGELLVDILKQNSSLSYKPDRIKVSGMGYHHDDYEIATGDILAIEKTRMNKEKLQKFEQKEDLAAYAVAHFIFGLKPPLDQTYVDIQREQKNKVTLESQIVDVADKWDAVCEILHDVRCGNKSFAKLLAFSKKTFDSFSDKYLFYKTIEKNPSLEFNKIPTLQEAIELPSIRIDDLKKPTDIAEFMSFEKTKGWPTCYRTWADLNKTIFDKSPEKFLFPGWYLQLWKNWGKPTSKTTASGLWIP